MFGKNRPSPLNEIKVLVDFDKIPEADAQLWRKGMLVPKKLAGEVMYYWVIDEQYWYWDEKGAGAYNALLGSDDYRVLQPNIDVLEKNKNSAIDAAIEFFRSKGSGVLPAVDFIALGVGTGEKELHLLDTLLLELSKASGLKGYQVYYVPLDISFPLLENSLRGVLSHDSFKSAISTNKLTIAPILADFMKIPLNEFGNPKNRFKLISALGIVWNAPVPDVFNALRSLIDKDRLLLIDVELVGTREGHQIASSYSNEEAKSFFYHPLELLWLASKHQNVAFKTINGEVKYYSTFEYYSRDNGQITATTVDSNTIYKFLDENNLPANARSKIMMPSEQDSMGSKTVIIYYKPTDHKIKTVVLGYSTRFTYKAFTNYIEKAGLSIYAEFLDNQQCKSKAMHAYFLLKVADKKSQKTAAKAASIFDVYSKWAESRKYSSVNTTIGAKTFSYIALKKGRLINKSYFKVCEIVRGPLGIEGIARFVNEVKEAKQSQNIGLAILLCEEEPAIDVKKYCEGLLEFQGNGSFRLAIVWAEEQLHTLDSL